MKSFAVLLAAALAVASPIKREVGGVLLCSGANATGTCQYAVHPLKTCVNTPVALNGTTNTFAVDGEAFECYPYVQNCSGICTSPEGCTLGAIDFGYAHKYNLSAVGWGTLMGSYQCHAKK